jgi:ferredoxin
VSVPSEFDSGIAKRKAIYIPFPQAVPNAYLVDEASCTYVQTNGAKCGACAKKCPKDCIDLDARAGRRSSTSEHRRRDRLRRADAARSSPTATACPEHTAPVRATHQRRAGGGGGSSPGQSASPNAPDDEWGFDPGTTTAGVAIIVHQLHDELQAYCHASVHVLLKFASCAKLPDAKLRVHIDMRAYGKGCEVLPEDRDGVRRPWTVSFGQRP